jgi:hypothetical protein
MGCTVLVRNFLALLTIPVGSQQHINLEDCILRQEHRPTSHSETKTRYHAPASRSNKSNLMESQVKFMITNLMEREHPIKLYMLERQDIFHLDLDAKCVICPPFVG